MNSHSNLCQREVTLTEFDTKQTRILRVLHIAIYYPLLATKIRGPKILEVSPCSD